MTNSAIPVGTVDAIPTFNDLLALQQAARASQALVAVDGTTLPPDDSPYSLIAAEDYALALQLSALYQYAATIVPRTDFAQATGDDLDREVAPYATRTPALAATKAFLLARQPGTMTPLIVPAYNATTGTGATFQVNNPFGGTPLTYGADQGAAEPPGVALTVQPGAATAWVLAGCLTPGISGNVAAGVAARLGSPLPGILDVSCPAAAVPQAPTASIVGTAGTAVRLYRVDGVGATGDTPPSPTTQVSTAPAVLTSLNYVHLDWTPGTDGGGVAPVAYRVSVSTDGGATWYLIATTTGTTFNDQGALGVLYIASTVNTSNSGVGGAEKEADEHLRERARNALLVEGSATPDAVRDAVLTVAGVTDCVTATTGAGTAEVRVVTVAYPPSDATIAQITNTMGATIALGTKVSAPIVIDPTNVSVSYSVVPDASVLDPSTLEPSIALAVTAVLNQLPLGAPVRFSTLIATMVAVAGVTAIDRLTLAANGQTYSGADIGGAPYTVYRTGAITRLAG